MFLLIGVIGSILVIVPFLVSTEAQITPIPKAIEKFTENDKQIKFPWLQYELYIHESSLVDSNSFLLDVESEKSKYTLKRIPRDSNIQLFCDHPREGQFYLMTGAYVFKERGGADSLDSWLDDRLMFMDIRYGEVYLTDNNHHWNNPTPDIILDFKTYGDRNSFDTIMRDCFT